MAVDTTKIQKIKDFNEKKSQASEKKNPPAVTTEEKIEKKAAETKEVREEEKKVEKAEKEQEEKEATVVKNATLQTNKAIEIVSNVSEGPRKWIEQLPTPGGIATILVILLFFLFAAVPVNSAGDTRLKLLWLSITGKTHLSYEDNTNNQSVPEVQGTPVIPSQPTSSGKKEENKLAVDLSNINFEGFNFFG